MKTHETTTSKGEFVVDEIGTRELAMCKFFNNPKMFRHGIHLQPMFLLSEATEEDASKVVDISFNTPRMYKDYINNMPGFTAVDSLHSLLKSKGIDINNGNWYLFKKV